MSKRVVMISAGASGIGLAMAKAFMANDYAVHICDASPAAVEQFQRDYPSATASVTDVSSVEQVDRLFDEIESRYGRLDVLINNAGIAGPTARVGDILPEEWDKTIAVDLNGVFYCTRRAAALLRDSKGSIINISSSAGLFGYPLRSPYVAAKWGVIGLTKTWAMEMGPDGVRVNAICPGSVSGPRIDGVIEREAANMGVSPEDIRDTYLRQTSLRTFVDAEDIAAMALFLCSDAGSKISGQALSVDGHTESLSQSS